MDITLTTRDLKELKTEGEQGSEDLCKLAELLGYKGYPNQLACSNGAYVSSLLHFFEDNPGCVEAIHDWVRNTFADDIESNDADVEYDESDTCLHEDNKCDCAEHSD